MVEGFDLSDVSTFEFLNELIILMQKSQENTEDNVSERIVFNGITYKIIINSPDMYDMNIRISRRD